MKRLRELSIRIARLERLAEENTSPHDVFIDNPLHRSVKELAESGALSNDPSVSAKSIDLSDNPDRSETRAKKESILAPPLPTEIKENAGGKDFSTLNQFVIETEEKVKGVPEGFEDAPKVDPKVPLPLSEKTNKEIKKEVIRNVMRRVGYVY